jgi:hypothetical protein
LETREERHCERVVRLTLLKRNCADKFHQ